MGRRTNELFIGREYLNLEGRSIKHHALIKDFANVNVNKISDENIPLFGIDLETNYKTAQLKLLGVWDGKQYYHYTDNFINYFFSWVKEADRKNTSLAYWNRLDPFVLFKQFLYELPPEKQNRALDHYGNIGGKWDNKKMDWEIEPVTDIMIRDFHFGIMTVIRSSILFYYHRKGEEPKTVWAYDIAQLYESHLEMEALGEEDKATHTYPNARLKYYSKGDESLHKIDWDRFNSDAEFKKAVLNSNYLDARAVYDLGLIIQEDFKKAFKYYPRSLVSQGSLARASIVATINNKYKAIIKDETKCMNKVNADIKSINLYEYNDTFIQQLGDEKSKDFFCLISEAYSGAYIESIRYGYSPNAYYADLASAYPSVIKELFDLRGCIITSGEGEPPHIKNSYCFIRGTVYIPSNVNYHPITVKHPINKNTNIRCTGEFKASYIIEERDFVLSIGGTFKDETWYNVETTGKLSPLAEVVNHFLELRAELKAKGDSAQYMAKIASNSVYGITYEATDQHEVIKEKINVNMGKNYDPLKERIKSYKKNINLSMVINDLKYHWDDNFSKIKARWHNNDGLTLETINNELKSVGYDLEIDNNADLMIRINEIYESKQPIELKQREIDSVVRAGYRAGEFYNPLYSTYITALPRIKIARACTEIEKQGGKPILMMTDSILWHGTLEMLPPDMWKEKKTAGYFEKPEEVTDIVCLGSGRYGYTDKTGYKTAKRRGLNATDIHDPMGIEIDTYDDMGEKINQFNWAKALRIMQRTKTDKLQVKVRVLISVGMLRNNHAYTLDDLGLIIDDERTVDAVVGHTKRFYDDNIKNPDILATQLVDTQPLSLYLGMIKGDELADQTLPILRSKMMALKITSTKDKKRKGSNKTSKTYNEKNKEKINESYNNNYKQLRAYGFESTEAKKYSRRSLESIMKLIEEKRRNQNE